MIAFPGRLFQHLYSFSSGYRHPTVIFRADYIPSIALGWAKQRGFNIDHAALNRSTERHIAEWQTVVEPSYQMENRFIFNERIFGWGFLGLSAIDYPADEVTDAVIYYLAAIQRPDGHWTPGLSRPPLGGGAFMATVLSLRALQHYPLEGRESEFDERIERAKKWLSSTQPTTHQERVFQLLGLGWTQASKPHIERATSTLIKAQRPDGGWAQLPGLSSDAWATGQTLVALNLGGGIETSHSAYQRGLAFLLRTEFDDGSWLVQRRAWPMQPLFDSQFPHGKDQWISAAATTLATMAMLLAIPDADLTTHLGTQQQQKTNATAASSLQNHGPPIRFEESIQPLLNRSCAGCHGGEKPKARFRVESRQQLLQGGESGRTSIVAGNAEESPLYLFPAGRVEDMEMPPLQKRQKYSALSVEELELLRNWINQGAP